jgi:hypothetical protein
MFCDSVGCGTAGPNAVSNAIDYAKHRSRSHDAVIRVYDVAGNVIETQQHAGVFGPDAQNSGGDHDKIAVCPRRPNYVRL